jgi:hypothetical protein
MDICGLLRLVPASAHSARVPRGPGFSPCQHPTNTDISLVWIISGDCSPEDNGGDLNLLSHPAPALEK